MNFGTDTSKIESLVTKLKANAEEVETIITNIYTKIDNLNGNGWQGRGYDSFAAECKAYEGSLKQIPDVINDFASYFEGTVTSNANTLHEKAVEGLQKVNNA